MANVIHVLKPFMFTYPAKEGERMTKEKLFVQGDHEVDDDVYSHPYIRDHFADGKIERPAQTKSRLEQKKIEIDKANAEAVIATANAQAAFARLTAAEPGASASAEDIERELNTPVSQLKTAQGAGIGTPVSTLKLKAG